MMRTLSMNRQWISSKYILPENNQKVYYFSNFLGIFRGEYFYDENSKSNPHKFYSEHGIVDADDISLVANCYFVTLIRFLLFTFHNQLVHFAV